jgi:hypothetical protein
MNRSQRLARGTLVAFVATLASMTVWAHSASDAYLTLTVPPAAESGSDNKTIIHAQWDIALRDLDFVLKLDDNDDGNIIWGELRKHRQAIAQYAYAYLRTSADGESCALAPIRQMVDDHADGAYASLMFDIICAGAPRQLSLDYRLFFAIDPSHRAILVLRNGNDIATSVLSLENTRIDLKL